MLRNLCACGCVKAVHSPTARFISGHNAVKVASHKIIGLHHQGLMPAEIAKRLRVSKQAVQQRLRSLGIAFKHTDRSIDLKGRRFGKLVVIKFIGKRRYRNGRSNRVWLCKCACGATSRVMAGSLNGGGTKSCGCSQGHLIDLIGRRFGRLRVIKLISKGANQKTIWLCKCDCGEFSEVATSSLRGRTTRSCGCLQREHAGRMAKCTLWKHGHARHRKETTEWRSWSNMLKRCYDPKSNRFAIYGGAGIRVYSGWLNNGEKGVGFKRFYKDLGPKPTPHRDYSLGRFGDVGNYTPTNCKWMSRAEQGAERCKKMAADKAKVLR